MQKNLLNRLTNLLGGYWYQDTLSFEEGIANIFREQSLSEINLDIELIDEFLTDREMTELEKSQYITETVDGEDFSAIDPLVWVRKVHNELIVKLNKSTSTEQL